MPRRISYRRVVGFWSMPRPVKRSKSRSAGDADALDKVCCLLKSGCRRSDLDFVLESFRAGRVRGRRSGLVVMDEMVVALGGRGYFCWSLPLSSGSWPWSRSSSDAADREAAAAEALVGAAPDAGARAGLRRSHMAAVPPQELLAAPPSLPLAAKRLAARAPDRFLDANLF